MIKGNTDLPIFVSAKINRQNVEDVIKVKPDGLVIGTSVVDADDPAEEIKFYKKIIS